MITAIIQARMRSTRLPGKVLMEVGDRPLLAYQLDRVSKSKKIDNIVVATSKLRADDAIENFCKVYGVDCFRGSENDVLNRYFLCAKQFRSNSIVRITADCPVIDPIIVDKVIQKFENDKVDYCSNNCPPNSRRFPDGMDVEVFTMDALEKANIEVHDQFRREHVTFQFWQDRQYKSSQLTQKNDWSNYRITVDYTEDFEVIKFLLNEFFTQQISGSMNQIIKILDNNKEVKEKNSQYFFGQGWNK